MQETILIESGKHRLKLLPGLGGSIASWDWQSANGWIPLFRPWTGEADDLYTVACFPLVPWSNRITAGGFEHQGRFYPVEPNRSDEAYPIHGDGWLQAWTVTRQEADLVELSLDSDRFAGNPYRYRASQTFRLLPDGLAIDLAVTHLDEASLPYGLGLHPYFLRNAETRLRFKSTGVWLAGKDPIPVGYTDQLPGTFDYNRPAPLQTLAGAHEIEKRGETAGEWPLIDHCFDGWDGRAEIFYPDRGIALSMLMENSPGYTLMYRPPQYDFFCLEPITQPIDAFHMQGMPGLAILSANESFTLRSAFMVRDTAGQPVPS